MGGRVFITAGEDGSPALHVPRMQVSLYLKLREKYRALLLEFFAHVVCPPEVPGKPDYGDIDYIAWGPTNQLGWEVEDIALALRAVRYQGQKGMHFAVASFCDDDDDDDGIFDGTEKCFTQIDLEVVDSVEKLRWKTFTKSYGDLRAIVNMTIRPFGLVLDDEGLNIEVKELRDSGVARKRARLRLTADADEAISFLGYDLDMYKHGFESETHVFQWLTSTSLFDSKTFMDSASTTTNAGIKKRILFRRFQDEFVPSLVSSDSNQSSQTKTMLTRQAVLDLAISHFEVGEVYRQKVYEALKLRKTQEVKEQTKGDLSTRFSD